MNQVSQRTLSSSVLGIILALWLVIVLVSSLLGVFEGAPSQPPLTVGLGGVLPLILFFGAWYGSSSVRHFIASLSLPTITLLQIGRIIGGVFLLEYLLGILPGAFALPAGLGDIAIGLTAPLVAWTTATRKRSGPAILLIWTMLGILDLVTAISLGILTSRSTLGILAGTTTSAAVTALPLSLIPTFLVPFYLILHLITLGRFPKYRGGQLQASEKMV